MAENKSSNNGTQTWHTEKKKTHLEKRRRNELKKSWEKKKMNGKQTKREGGIF
jgi:hypothetical protein